MYAVGTSAYELHESALNFVDELTKEGGGDPLQLFHYFSNMLVNIAGVSYGVTGIAGGISMFDGITSSGGSQVKPKQQSETSIIENEGGSELGEKRLYRVMSEAELDAVKDTGMLRGGREGTTFFTDSYYKNSNTAKSRLSLPEKPKYIMEFEIEGNPEIYGGTRVKPAFGELGGGREYFTDDVVKVKIINYQKMIGGN